MMPKPLPKMSAWVLPLLLIVLAGGAAACSRDAHHGHDHGGAAVQSSVERGGEREVLYWVAPMDASFTSPTPGKSPMGMDLVPVYRDDVGAASDVSGRAVVTIDPRRAQQLGVRTQAAVVTDAVRTIRAVGLVQVDERRIHHIHSRVHGWLEHVAVHAVGDPVAAGQVLYHIYSPELMAVQQEMLGAIAAGNFAAADAARSRLRLWNVADRDIAAIEAAGSVRRTVPFRSPVDGYVHHLNALYGMAVRPEQELYMLVNLDRIWVHGKFYESELPLLHAGAEAIVEVPAGERLRGQLEYVYPTVDASTRFATARFSFANPGLRLRPGMYVDVRYRADMGPALVVPGDAVIRTGTRAVAFVDEGGGRFSPREVDVGPKVDGGVIVYGGLDDGEAVASQANFFIDSESSLKAALAKFSGGGGEHNH